MCAFTLDGIGNIVYTEMPETQNQRSGQSQGQQPQLPKCNSSILRSVSENLSFHASPESFIIARIRQLQKHDPAALDSRTPVRAKILNRTVAIISSYRQVQSILTTGDEGEEESTYVASSAYSQLMSQFFPPPNLLLSDGCPHKGMRQRWDHKMSTLQSSSSHRLRGLIASFWKTGVPLGTSLDLYELMKTLAWRILLDTFLKLAPYDEGRLFDEYRRLQEDLLRGQFSLMPVSINARVWQSPRSKGIAARKKLQSMIADRLHMLSNQVKSPFDDAGTSPSQGESGNDSSISITEADDQLEEVRDHVLMMTSSLAAKALASLLTALLLNLCFFKHGGNVLLNSLRTMNQSDQSDDRMRHLRSVYMETERLSPPIVGIMRRLSRDAVIGGWDGETDTLLPAKWDAWLYFVSASRDQAVFGADCQVFNPSRYLNTEVAEPLGFGVGSKSCLGKDFIRDIVLLTAELFLDSRLELTGDVLKPGVKAWLGWEVSTPKVWAADMKQLPTQRPAAPINVEFSRLKQS